MIPNVSSKWLRAALAGSLWASIEIILGSFLHNLRIPFAGSILAFIGVILMTTFYLIWPVRGILIRVGLVCALMKSMSPSAVLFGPMIGILLESVFMEVAVRIMGKNRISLTIGAVLAMMSALLHKVLSLLILYGSDLIKILENMLQFVANQTRFQPEYAWIALYILIAVYITAGVMAVLAGHNIYRRIKRTEDKNDQSFQTLEYKDWPGGTNHSDPLLILLILHIIMIPFIFYLITVFGSMISYSILAIYTLICIIYYRKGLGRIKKPLFWYQLLVILLLSVLFIGILDDEKNSMQGLVSGLQMCMRAVFLVVGFSSVSIELRNPVVAFLFSGNRVSGFYNALTVAFAALPVMIQNIPRPSVFLKEPQTTFSVIILKMIHWVEKLESQKTEI